MGGGERLETEVQVHHVELVGIRLDPRRIEHDGGPPLPARAMGRDHVSERDERG